MSWPRWLTIPLTWLDYGLVLEVLARLPRPLARPLTSLRARVNERWDLDWRTWALGHGYVRAATLQAMERVLACGSAPPGQPDAFGLVRQRYLAAAREEVDSVRLPRIDYARLPHHIDGLAPLLEAQRAGRGTLLLTAHYDSLYIGLALLARAGLRIVLMGTGITEDPRVPPAITRHYLRKKAALNKLLAPGQVVYFEGQLHTFVRALRRGDVVVMACDGAATGSDRAEPVDFLDGRYRMASGAQFFAEAARVPVALYSSWEDATGTHQVQISQPLTINEGGLQAAYAALHAQLLRDPGRWWAADQMRDYRSATAATS